MIKLHSSLDWAQKTPGQCIAFRSDEASFPIITLKGQAAALIMVCLESEIDEKTLQKTLKMNSQDFQLLIQNLNKVGILDSKNKIKLALQDQVYREKNWEIILETIPEMQYAFAQIYCGSMEDHVFTACPTGFTCQPCCGDWCMPWYCVS